MDGSAKAPGKAEADSLENLLTTLSSQINSSNWLQQNTADKFAAENPEVAQAFKNAVSESESQKTPEETDKK